MARYPPRRGRGRPRKTVPLSVQKKRANIFRSLYPRRPIQAMTHMIKRLAQPVFIQNSAPAGAPTITNAGVNSFFQTSPTPGPLPGTWEWGMSSQYQLSSVLDVGDLTQLFDRYKITGVKLKIHYLQNASFIPGASNLPTFHYAFDGDDADLPASSTTVLSKAYCKSKVLNANKPLSVFITPRLTKEIYNSPLTTGYSSERACYLDCNSSTIPHFGMKFWITDWVGGADNNNAIRIQPTYYLALKDTQ